MQSANQSEVHRLVDDSRSRLNNIVLNGELARLLLQSGSSEQKVLSKIDKIVEDTKQTASMVQEWYDQTDIK